MFSKKIIILVILSALDSSAGEYSEHFKKLETTANDSNEIKMSILLKPFGDISEFKIIDESTSSDECLYTTKIRAKVECSKKGIVKSLLFFADGKGLLCKIYDNLKAIKCLPK